MIARLNENACVSWKLKAAMGSCLYFLGTSFMVIGKPFAEHSTRSIPIFGIILTLPWSLAAAAIHYSSAMQGTITLEICAALNAWLMFVVLSRKAKRSCDDDRAKEISKQHD